MFSTFSTDPTHPIWLIVKALTLLAFVVLFAWTNAANFDETEIKMLTEIGLVLFGSAALESFLKKRNTT